MSEIRSWLARSPHPSTVRIERADGEEKTVRIGVTRSKWRDAESAIGSDVVRAEALDEQGAVLRVWESDTADEQRKKGQASPEQAQAVQLTRFAELLTDACDKAVQRHTEFVNVAFNQLGELVKLYATRNAMLEKAWHKLLVDSAEAQAEAAQANDPSDAIIGGIVQAALMPKPEEAKNGKAKGKS